MASALKLSLVLVVSSVFTGCYAPDVVELSTKLSTQCGLSLSAPNCVDPADEAVMDRLWERYVLAKITSADVEACVLAMECSSEEDLNSTMSSAEALDACVNTEDETQNPSCMWHCLSAFLDCSPASGDSCDADFVEGCLNTREACEYRC